MSDQSCKPVPRDKELFECSFCGKGQHEVARLIAGVDKRGIPVFVCNECIEVGKKLKLAPRSDPHLCSFCAQSQNKDRSLFEGKDEKRNIPIYICSECMEVCKEILKDPVSEPLE